MKNQLARIVALCAAGLVIQAQAQTSSDTSGSAGPSTSPGSSSSTSSGGSPSTYGGSSSLSGHHYGMGRQEERASQLKGAQVTGSSGQQLGTINDCIVNANAGRIDFAVLALNSSSSASSSSSTASSPSTSASSPSLSTPPSTTTSSGGEKLVAVPWRMLRPSNASSGSSSSSSTVGSSSSSQVSFTFEGDASKLQSAPSFTESNWPDFSQPTYVHSIFSYFGMSPGAATGAAESPGGTSGTGSSDSSSQSPSSSSQSPSSSSSSGSSTTPQR